MSEIRNVIIIGETGCGKSTFINYLTNFFLKGTLQRPKIAIPNKYFNRPTEDFQSNENAVLDTSKSKTTVCQKYEFEWNNEEYCFIDTPGISDTNGLDHDKRNIEKITQIIREMKKFTAIILIVNGTQARITTSLSNVLHKIRQLLPNDVVDNMIIILTNCNSYSVNFDPQEASFPVHLKVFYMQNSAFSSQPQDRTDRQKRDIEQAWEASLETVREILNTIVTLECVESTSFVKMYDMRNEIKSFLHEARMTAVKLRQIGDALAVIEEKYTRPNEIKNEIQKFEISEPLFKSVNYMNMLCQRCTKVCHEKCIIREQKECGQRGLSACEKLRGGKCHECRCSYTDHYHARKEIITRQRKITQVILDLSKSKNTRLEQSFELFQQGQKVLENSLNQLYEKIEIRCRQLKETCAEINVVDELYQFVNDLEKDCEKMRLSSAKEKTSQFIRNLNELCTELSRKQKQEIPINSKNVPLTVSKREAGTTIRENLTTGLRTKSTIKHDQDDDTADKDSVADKYGNVQDSKRSPRADQPKLELRTGSPVAPYNGIINRKEQRNRQSENEIEMFEEYSNERLLAAYHTCKEKEDSAQQKRVQIELKKRCSGKSIGYLSQKQHIFLCETYMELSNLKQDERNTINLQLVEKINELTEYDETRIEDVPEKLLLQLAAVRLLFPSEGESK